MDPEVALKRLRDIVAPINRTHSRFATAEERVFAENFTALDTWLSNDGFLPRDWESAVRTDNKRLEADRGGDRGTG